MKTLKALGLFVAGGFSAIVVLAKAFEQNTTYPREGAVVYENDDVKVVRINAKPNKTIDLATIVHKKKD